MWLTTRKLSCVQSMKNRDFCFQLLGVWVVMIPFNNQVSSQVHVEMQMI